MSDRELALGIRQAALMFLDVLERYMEGKGWLSGPRTAELRKIVKRQGRQP